MNCEKCGAEMTEAEAQNNACAMCDKDKGACHDCKCCKMDENGECECSCEQCPCKGGKCDCDGDCDCCAKSEVEPTKE